VRGEEKVFKDATDQVDRVKNEIKDLPDEIVDSDGADL
jgi:hypothetical protein